MAKFYGNFTYINDPRCGAHIQALLFDENGTPVDCDWARLQEIYTDHNNQCSEVNPYTNDPNAYYGDPQPCTGFIETGVPESGYKYCEY